MFCPKCGNAVQPNETFCAACGTQVTQQPAAAPAQPQQEPKKNPLDVILANKKLVIAAAGAVLAVILAIVLLNGCSAQSSAEKVAKAYVVASLTDDIEAEVDLRPEFFLEYMAEEVYDMKEYDEDKLIRKIKKARDVDEPDDDMEIEIIELEVLDDKDDKKDAKSELKAGLKSIDCYDMMKEIDDYVYVSVGYEADDDDGEFQILCIKMSGKWYVLG